MNCSLLPFVLLLCAICHFPVQAAPREADWAKAMEAVENKHPKTAASQLSSIERKAFADKAFAEGAKALAMRVALENRSVRDSPDAVRQLATEIRRAPVEARPVLTLLEAKWLLSWYDENQSKVDEHSAVDLYGQDQIETWDRARVLAEIDRRCRSSLADQEMLKAIPIAGFDALLDQGELGDDLRPTLFDFLAHEAIRFYSMEENSRVNFQESFDFTADSPALAKVDDFLAWKPESPTPTAPQFVALRLYQNLLEFHRHDPDQTAFLHCDLQRIRWAGKACVPLFDKTDRLDAALRSFINKHSNHPLSADARIDVAASLIKNKRTKEAHDFVKVGAEAFPEHAFGKLCRYVMTNLEDRECQVITQSHWTGSGEQITVEHANVSRIWFRIYPQSWTADVKTLERDPTPWADWDGNDEVQQKNIARLVRSKPAKAWEAALPDDRDFASHITHFPIPSGLPPGYYILVASGSPGFELQNNYLSPIGVHVTRYAMVTRDENGRLSGFVTDARTGAPVAGIPVSGHLLKEKTGKLASNSVKTDSDGWFSFPKQEGDSLDVLVVAGLGNDRVIQRSSRFSPSEIEVPEPEEFVEWFTDREIYRPGGTIQFKGIWFHWDLAKQKFRTLTGRKASVTLSDPNGKSIEKLELISNEYGSFSGSFVLPAGGLCGRYKLSAPDSGYLTSVSVEEYKRPKFSAAFDPRRTGATIGKPVTVTGRARAYTGAPIDGAKVKWSVSRTTVRAEGRSDERYFNQVPVANGATSSATDGSFFITFSALPDLRINPDSDFIYAYEIKADVTDPSGETRSIVTTIQVSRSTFEATLTANDWLQSDRPVALRVRTATLDEVGQAAEGVLKIHKLREPAICPRGGSFKDRFKDKEEVLRPDQSASPARWELAEAVAEIPVKTLADADAGHVAGEAEIKTSLPAGVYRAVFTTRDGNGRVVEAVRELQVIDPQAKRFSSKHPFFVVRDADKVEPGQTLSLLWGSGHPEARACVEWFRLGKLLKREWSTPGRTQQCFTFTPDDSMRGGIAVHVTQSTLNSFHEYADVIKVPWTNKKLNLRWEHIRSKLQPGENDTWTAVISGMGGAGVAAEMVATLYDASLDAIYPRFVPELDERFEWYEDHPFEDPEFSGGFGEDEFGWGWDQAGYFSIKNFTAVPQAEHDEP